MKQNTDVLNYLKYKVDNDSELKEIYDNYDYINEILKEFDNIFINSDMPNSKKVIREIKNLVKQKLQEVEQRKVDEITKLFDRKMLKTKGERPDVACHRGGYNERVFEEWEIIKLLLNK